MPKRKFHSNANISTSKRRKKDEDLGDGTWKVREVLDEDKEKGYLLQWEGINSQTGREYTPEWVPSKDVGPGLIADWESQRDRARPESPLSEVAESLSSSPRRSGRSKKPSRRIIESSPSTATVSAPGSAPGPVRRLQLIFDDSPDPALGEPAADRSVSSSVASRISFGGPLASTPEAERASEESPADTVPEDLPSPTSQIRPYIAVPQPSQFDPAEYGSQPPTQFQSSQVGSNSKTIDTNGSPLIANSSAIQDTGSPDVGHIRSNHSTSPVRELSELIPDSQEIAETQPESLLRRFGDIIEGNTQRILESSLLADEGVDIGTTPRNFGHHSHTIGVGPLGKEDLIAKSAPDSSTSSQLEQNAVNGQEGSIQPSSTTSNVVSQSSKGPSEDEPSIDFTQGVINPSTSSESHNGVSQGPSDFATQLPFYPTQQASTYVSTQESESHENVNGGDHDERVNGELPKSIESNGNDHLSALPESDSASTYRPQLPPVDRPHSIAHQITSSVIDKAVASTPKIDSISSPLPPPSQSLERASNAPPRPQTPSTMATPGGGTPTSGRSGLTYGQKRALSRLEIYGEPLPDDFPDQWKYLANDPSSISKRLEELQTAVKRKRGENTHRTSSRQSPMTVTDAPSVDGLSTGNDATPEAISAIQPPRELLSKDSVVKGAENLGVGMDFYLPVTLTSDQRDLYLETLRFHQKTIDDFLSSANDDCSTELQEMARSVLERLHHFIFHPDLLDDGSWTQKDENPTQKAQWDVKASSKLKLLKAFFDKTCHSEKHVVILVEAGRVMDLVETFLSAIKISYFRPDQHRQFESSRGPLRVTLLQTGQEGSRNISSRAHLVIGLDATFSRDDPQVKQVRRHLLEVGRNCPVVSLVVVSSVEHVSRRISKDLSEVERMRMTLSQARELRGQVGLFTEEMPQPQEVGEAMAAAMLSENPDSWFLSSIQNIQLPLLDPTERVSSSAREGSGGKRPLDDSTSPTSADPAWKRPRTATLQGDEELLSSINRIPDSNIASTSAEAQARALLEEKIAELTSNLETATCKADDADARAKISDERAASFETQWNAMRESNNSLEIAINDLQTRFEDLTREKHSLVNRLNIAETAAAGAQTSIETLRTNNAALKTERSQLRNELAEATKPQPVVGATTGTTGVPTASESPSSPTVLLEDTTTLLRKAEKKITSLTGEIEFLRSQYQSASTAAAESAATIANLQSENTTLQSRASDTASKLRSMYETEAVKRANGAVTRLEREKQSLEKAIGKMSDENKRLKEKEQRLGMAANTRASSLPPGVAPPGLHASVRSVLGSRGGGGGVGGGSRSKPGSRQGSRAPSPGPGSNDKVGVGRGGGEKGGVEMARSASQGSTSARTTGARIQLNLGRMSHLRD